MLKSFYNPDIIVLHLKKIIETTSLQYGILHRSIQLNCLFLLLDLRSRVFDGEKLHLREILRSFVRG